MSEFFMGQEWFNVIRYGGDWMNDSVRKLAIVWMADSFGNTPSVFKWKYLSPN